MQMKPYQNTVQGHAKVGKNAHYLLFDGRPQGSGEPYALSSKTFTWDDQDRNFLRTMRSWGATQGMQALNQGGL